MHLLYLVTLCLLIACRLGASLQKIKVPRNHRARNLEYMGINHNPKSCLCYRFNPYLFTDRIQILWILATLLVAYTEPNSELHLHNCRF